MSRVFAYREVELLAEPAAMPYEKCLRHVLPAAYEQSDGAAECCGGPAIAHSGTGALKPVTSSAASPRGDSGACTGVCDGFETNLSHPAMVDVSAGHGCGERVTDPSQGCDGVTGC